MNCIDALSSILIETLKEFSSGGQGLTQESLSKALSSKKEISQLFSPDSQPTPLAISECTPPHSYPSIPGADGERHPLPCTERNCRLILQNTLLKILHELSPLSREENLQQVSELQSNLQNCISIDDILALDARYIETIRLLIGRTIEEVEHTRGFLAELGRDLSGVEKQILSYHGIHQESYHSNVRFSGDLISQTNQMKDALDAGNEYGHVREFIVSRLAAVKTAVETKQKEDEERILEADRRLTELQTTLENHREEIAQAKQRAEELEKEVLLDSLTGIHNRRAYELRIREALRRFHRDGQSFSLALIDVDHFKEVNDCYGHRTGDRCLREIALRIKSVLRNIDFLARYGGEEFVAILPGTPLDGSRAVAERIRSLIERTRFRYQESAIPVTVSLGVTEACPRDDAPEAIFTRVDNAMYTSKNEGRNRITVL